MRKHAFVLLCVLGALPGAQRSVRADDHGFQMPAAKSIAPQPRTIDLSAASAASIPGCLVPDRSSDAWFDKQTDVAARTFLKQRGGLLSGVSFLSPDVKKALGKIEGTPNGQDPGMKLVETPLNSDGFQYAFDTGDGQRWFVSEQPWYKDQFDGTTPGKTMTVDKAMLVLWKQSSTGADRFMVQTQIDGAIDLKTGRVNFAKLREYMRAAEDARKSELADASKVRDWKLTGPVGYIGLLDDGYRTDPIMRAMVKDLRNFPRMMNTLAKRAGRDCDFYGVGGSEFVVAQSDPKALLQKYVNDMPAGVKTVYLNLAGHGNQQGIYFHLPGQTRPVRLSPDDLVDIFNSRKDLNFVVNTVACHGGGLGGMMEAATKKIEGDPKRVRIFLQSKISGVNQEGRINGETDAAGVPTPYSTYYQVMLTHFLSQGLEYGEAHYRADQAAKRFNPSDAETWIPGGIGTKGIGTRGGE